LGALGNAYAWDGDFDAAYPLLARQVALNPNSADAHRDMASLLYYMARFDEVKPQIEMALRLGPLDASNVGKSHGLLGFVMLVQGHNEEAYAEFHRTLVAEPAMFGPRFGLVAAAALTHRDEEAHRLLSDALRERPNMTIARVRALRN